MDEDRTIRIHASCDMTLEEILSQLKHGKGQPYRWKLEALLQEIRDMWYAL